MSKYGDSKFKNGRFFKGSMELEKLLGNELKQLVGPFYNPDVVLKLADGKMIIIEHSPTGDRKVHIGEMLQAFEFGIKNEIGIVFVLVLDGVTDTSPTVGREQQRLDYYAEFLRAKTCSKLSFDILVTDMANLKKNGVWNITFKEQ